MSINVTVNGNPISIKRGRMVLSDLDQIKKNERDRRRRLRLEQVRQQSKEISDRLLDRAKNIAKEELKKFQSSDKQNLRDIYNEKIMEVQQKYQEDMADIGEAHICATLEPDYNAVVQEKERRNKLAALRRAKQPMKDVNNTQKDTEQQLHRERLHQVRDLEKRRSTMVAELHQNTVRRRSVIREDIDEENEQHKPVKKRIKKILVRKSPGKVTKSYTKVVAGDFKTCSPVSRPKSKASRVQSSVPKTGCVVDSVAAPSTSGTTATTRNTERIVDILEFEHDDKDSRKAVTISNGTPIEADRLSRYNPEDYAQPSSDSTASNNGNSSNSFSDDSSYFSDNSEQSRTSKCTRISKPVSCPASSKVQLYDHSKHQRKMYEKPVGVVEKIHLWNEPSAIDLAQEIGQPQTTETHLAENRKLNAQKRGENAMLREKVRRDYQAFVQNLSHLASEERKLKASQIEHYPKDVHMQEERRRILRDEHKKKLNRAIKTLLNDECLQQCKSYPMEKQITLTPRDNNKIDEMHVSWDVPCSSHEHTEARKNSQNKCKESETSRDEQILSMLQKVEKQRQLLLKEFGANLPNDIFNATVKPLFEKEKSSQAQSIAPQKTDIQKSPSPEIRVINSSCHCENTRSNEMGEKNNSSVGKVETAVQTTTECQDNIAEDKSVQVELIQEKGSDFHSTNNETEGTTTHYPIEPIVTVITTKADSSESTSSATTNRVTDTDKPDSKITSKKEHDGKTLRQVPSKKFQKSCTMRASKAASFTKKFSKSLRKARYSSLKKVHSGTADVPSKRIKIYVNNNGCNIKVNPPETADIAVDVSTQSSRVYVTGTQEQSTSKLHCAQSELKRIKTKDISDSSTSFASPPPMKPKDIFEVLNNNISILEMLDSSANETMKFVRKDVSPVSTPNTPSPRTMKMPSNVPHLNKISRMLKFASTEKQINDNNTPPPTKSGYTTSTDTSDYQRNEHVSENITASWKQPLASLEFCLCKNPECKLMHAKFNNIQNYALKNCPQILQKYEDLQNMCAERIVSLTNLIEKVRNDQKGMELSGISADDESSLMQLPPPKLMASDLQSIRNLVENIEAIHNQLAATLIESQKIFKANAVVQEETHQTEEMEVVTLTSGSTSKSAMHSTDSKAKVPKARTKPRIISEERVNIQLDAFKIQHRPQTSLSVPAERDFRHASKFHDEKVIEMISKEILEQSKSFSNNATETKESDKPMVNRVIQTSTDTNDSKPESSLKTQRSGITTEKGSNKEFKKTEDFVPLLADIPKISRPTTENAMFCNGRSKPPVSLLSGPYRAEIESSGHELSTIIEFDTPDTLNKSQNNVRSPSSIKKIAETQITKPAGRKNLSEHDAPLNTQDEHFEKWCTSISKACSVGSTQKVEVIVPCFDSSKPPGSTDSRNLMKYKGDKKSNVTPETSNKKLQCDTENQPCLYQAEELQSIAPIIISPNKKDKNNKDNVTSTSSNSFSGLSGVSQIASTPSSDIFKYASSPEEMETALKKLGLGWAITTLKKTREASALSSSSNSDDRTPINTAKRIISPGEKQFDSNYGLPDFSDVSSISIKEASKSTEQAVLLKGRTSTPKLENSKSISVGINSRNTNVSENDQEPGDSLVIPNMSLYKRGQNISRN